MIELIVPIALGLVALAGVAFALGLDRGAEWSRPRHEQDCLRKLGFDPVAVPFGGIAGELVPGQQFVLHPACPERRTLLTYHGPSPWMRVEGGAPCLLFTDEDGVQFGGSERYLRDHAARFEPMRDRPLTQK